MDEFLKITCPCCDTILVIDRIKGNIVETREPIVDESSGDRFEDAFEKVRHAKEAAEAKFTEAQQKERERKAKLESLFNDGLKRAKDEGEITRPHRDFDLD